MKRIVITLTSVCLILTLLLCSCGSKETEKQTSADGIDVDLTQMNSTMVYSKVNDMVNTNPESYIGDSVKVKGIFATSEDEKYFFVVIADATACCSQGIELLWDGHTYPDDFPKAGEEIELTGAYDSYDENGTKYYCISIDNLNVMS